MPHAAVAGALHAVRRPSRSASGLRRATAAAALALFAAGAQAVGLGEVTQQSELGRPLRIVIPIIANATDNLSPECFRVVPASRDGDGVPEITNARIAVERAGSGNQLVVATTRAVNDPAVRIALQAGCENVVRREFVLLLDPEPVVASAATAPAALPASRGDVAAPAGGTAATSATPRLAEPERAGAANPPAAAAEPTPQRPPAMAAGATVGATVSQPPPRATPAPRAAPPRPPTTVAKPAAPPKAPPPSAAPVVAQPRLTVSSSAPVPAGAGANPEKPPQSALDATNALEAETIVLRQRVTELSNLVERMQLEMRAAQATQAARQAAEEAARSEAASQATLRRWWDGASSILAVLLVLALLLAAVLTWKRRRVAAPATDWRTTQSRPGNVAPSTVPSEIPAASAVEPTPLSAAPPSAAPPEQRNDVDVSELSHVTEEAGVYLAFNRVDRAIEVLRDHIHGQPRSLPAAWLMLLDIYRSHGREPEFRELATAYHRQFNAQAPHWDADAAPDDETGAGLEAFPHVVNQLIRLWGKPECREFLELLLYDNRDGRRVGFSPAAYSDILLLRQISDPAMATDDTQRFGGHELRPAWAASPDKPAAAAPMPSRTSAAPAAPIGTGMQGPRSISLDPLPAAPRPVAAPRPNAPAALDLEIAFDEDITKAAPPPRDKPPGRS